MKMEVKLVRWIVASVLLPSEELSDSPSFANPIELLLSCSVAASEENCRNFTELVDRSKP
jgi:hypothetical protein